LAYTGKLAHGASGSEQQLFKGWNPDTTDITVGTESSNVVNVAVQFQDASGTDMAEACYATLYFSDDAAGQTLATTAVDTVAVGTDGTIIKEVTAGKVYEVVSEADGDLDLNLTQDGADTLYLQLVGPDGTLKTSSVITWTV
jgi:hypothetical protein